MEEGRVRLDGSDWVYEYQLTDHLGNVRVTFGDLNDDGILDPNTEIQDANDYYPFGLRMAGENTLAASPGNEYLYNGKELQDELRLGWYDYGFRWYDPEKARFVSVDPLAEKFVYLTTYQYASNDPIRNIDLDGLEGVDFNFLKDKGIEMVRKTVSDALYVGSSVSAPIGNAVTMIVNEGVHEGRAYKSTNSPYAPLKLDENWNIIPTEPIRDYTSQKEGVELAESTVNVVTSVIPLKVVENPVSNYIVSGGIKTAFKNLVNKGLERFSKNEPTQPSPASSEINPPITE
ncbi:MAG: RHS repeat-associated core domain-containing protein [Bacteroidia bacterium]|nr:RHS repeat-associated core domain-containing protein [Bacteroidia bacterium]